MSQCSQIWSTRRNETDEKQEQRVATISDKCRRRACIVSSNQLQHLLCCYQLILFFCSCQPATSRRGNYNRQCHLFFQQPRQRQRLRPKPRAPTPAGSAPQAKPGTFPEGPLASGASTNETRGGCGTRRPGAEAVIQGPRPRRRDQHPQQWRWDTGFGELLPAALRAQVSNSKWRGVRSVLHSSQHRV